jgi:type IV pilus assembly protein PilA
VDVRGSRDGFTMIEILVAVAIVAILAALAIPSFQGSIVRDQIVAAMPLADIAKKPVAQSWAALQVLPADNASAGLPPPDKIVNNYISAVAIQDGAIQVTFGNNAHGAIAGKILTLRPAIVEDAPIVPVAWVCGYAAVPGKMTAKGENRTGIPTGYLPFNCRESAR